MKKAELMHIVALLLRAGEKKKAARLLWPWMEQHQSTVDIWHDLDNNQFTGFMGHASASKTFTCAAWYLLDWWTDPANTALILTSDTVPSLRKRLWTDIKTLKERTPIVMPGRVVDSKGMILFNDNDEKNAIHCVAGESSNAQSKIQGIHTKRVRLLIDEADNPFSKSVWGAMVNLMASGDFKCSALANPVDKYSEYGQHCEPAAGWATINPDTDHVWRSKAGWNVRRLDGLRSPNVLLGEDKYPYLLTNQAIKTIQASRGVNSPYWWIYVRAFFPPVGTVRQIFTPEILGITHEPIVWYSEVKEIAACDSAFEGGDRCVLYFGRMGKMAKDPTQFAVEASDYVEIKRLNPHITITQDFGDQIIDLCKSRGVNPEDFAIDCTTIGLGLSDYIRAKWSMSCIPVQFGKAPSEMRITKEDTMKANERFHNFVTELWFSAREWCRLGLVYIKDSPAVLFSQLEARNYEEYGKGKILIESKSEMKTRIKESPDHGDAFCLLIHIARIRSTGAMPATFKEKAKSNDPLKIFRKHLSVFDASYGVKS